MRTVLLLSALLLLAGCDFVYGVRRYEDLPSLPDLACVEKVVRAAPGVRDVRYRQDDGGRPVSLSGIEQPTKIYTFFYSGDAPKIWGALQLEQDYSGKVSFDQTHLTMNHLPDPVVIANTRPVMRHIELALSKECGLVELPASIKETCMKVACPPMAGNDDRPAFVADR